MIMRLCNHNLADTVSIDRTTLPKSSVVWVQDGNSSITITPSAGTDCMQQTPSSIYMSDVKGSLLEGMQLSIVITMR